MAYPRQPGVSRLPGALLVHLRTGSFYHHNCTVGLMKTTFRHVVLFALALTTVATLTGCLSVGSSSQSASSHTDVVGTWTYEASGTQPLSRGTLQLATRNGRLLGQIRDSELGTVPIQANMTGRRLELQMDLFRVGPLSVAGSVEGDTFHGLIDRPVYNVTMDANEAASARETNLYGSFQAERRAAAYAAPLLVLNCPKLGPDGIVACR